MDYYDVKSPCYVDSGASVTCQRQGNMEVFLTSCLNDAHPLRLSSRRQKRARKAGTDQTACVCIVWDARMTVIQEKGYWTFQTEVDLIVSYCCRKFNVYYLLSCRDNSTLICFSAKPLWPCIKVKVTVTSISMYATHTSTVIASSNAIA